MDWPIYQDTNPVYLNAVRPGRGRPRLGSEHPNRQQGYYVQDANGMLVAHPAAPAQPLYRSSSTSARPSPVIIHNTFDDHSPSRGHHHRHCSRGRNRYDYESDSSEESHSPRRRRARSHVHHHHPVSRSPSPRYQDPNLERRMKKLEDMEKEEREEEIRKAAEQRKKLEEIERKEEENERRKRYEEEKLAEAERQRQKENDEKKRKEQWVEEWKHEQEEKKRMEEKKKQEEDEAFRERALRTFGKVGYSEDSVAKILDKAGKKEGGKEGKELKHSSKHHDDSGKQLMRPTYIKVNKKHLSTDTLDVFELPWEWDQRDPNYIIIKRWIPEHDQELLFEHTTKLREKQQLETTTVELRKRKGELQLVQKRPGRSRSRPRSRMFS